MPESALAKKLQIRPHQKLLVLDAPAGYIDELGGLPVEQAKIAPSPYHETGMKRAA